MLFDATSHGIGHMYPATSPLLTDLYQLNMLQAYLDHGQTDTAVFEFFVRRLPARRGFLMAAGLEQALDFLENLQFSQEEIDWLRQSYRFTDGFLDSSEVCASPATSMQCRKAPFSSPTNRSFA
jgi:nicotinic acid phosphoribosyltransferase